MEKERNVIFISGATSGIGRASAFLFAQKGFDVILTGRRKERLDMICREIEQQFRVKTLALNFDVRNEKEVNEAIQSVPAGWTSRLTVLLNNAGLAAGRAPIDQGDTGDWDQMIDTNIKGLLYVTKAVLPFFKGQNQGHIVNISSIAGKEVYASGNVYCATKHAVDALSKSMRIDLLRYGIKVTNVAPGAVETEFSLVRYKGSQELADATYDGYEPLVAEDIADTIYYAVSRPRHVVINDLLIMPAAQANATLFRKEEK